MKEATIKTSVDPKFLEKLIAAANLEAFDADAQKELESLKVVTSAAVKEKNRIEKRKELEISLRKAAVEFRDKDFIPEIPEIPVFINELSVDYTFADGKFGSLANVSFKNDAGYVDDTLIDVIAYMSDTAGQDADNIAKLTGLDKDRVMIIYAQKAWNSVKNEFYFNGSGLTDGLSADDIEALKSEKNVHVIIKYVRDDHHDADAVKKVNADESLDADAKQAAIDALPFLSKWSVESSFITKTTGKKRGRKSKRQHGFNSDREYLESVFADEAKTTTFDSDFKALLKRVDDGETTINCTKDGKRLEKKYRAYLNKLYFLED